MSASFIADLRGNRASPPTPGSPKVGFIENRKIRIEEAAWRAIGKRRLHEKDVHAAELAEENVRIRRAAFSMLWYEFACN